MSSSFRPVNVSGSPEAPQGSDSKAAFSVLFVCLGNICRSPLAEGMLVHLLAEEGMEAHVEVDSAGTGAWHAGEAPDPRSVEVALRNGVRLQGTARQVRPDDFSRFTHIIAMDLENLRNLEVLGERSGGPARLALLREWDPEGGAGAEVPDPYYGGPGGFDDVFRMVERSCRALLQELKDVGSTGGSAGTGG